MTKIRLILLPYAGLLLLVVASINLALPSNSYAIETAEGDYIALSITPTAEPPQPTTEPPQPTTEPPQPTTEPPSEETNISNDSDDDDESISQVKLQIDSCGLICEVNNIQAPFQVAGKVQLVHEGTNFIVEGNINNSNSQQFNLPYSGKWQVFLNELFNPPLDNNNSVELPAELGSIDSNISAVQLVSCPIDCSIDTSTFQKIPPESLLPTTGTEYDTLSQDWIKLGLASSLLLVLIIAGFVSIRPSTE